MTKKVEAWVREYFRKWNLHNATDVAASFAPDGWERSLGEDIYGHINVGKANADIFQELPNVSIEILAVHVLSAKQAALVEVRIENETNKTLCTDWDFIEFSEHGLIKAMRGSLSMITKSLKSSKGDDDQGSLKISGLPMNGNDLYLYTVFAPFGAIRHAQAELAEDGTCTGDGFVEFVNAVDAQRAISSVNGKKPDNVIDGITATVLHVSLKPPEKGKAEKD